MDYEVPSPGGVAPGHPNAIAARGADPLLVIPAASLLNSVKDAPFAVSAAVPGSRTLPYSYVATGLGCGFNIGSRAILAAQYAGLEDCAIRLPLPQAFDRVDTQLVASGLNIPPNSLEDVGHLGKVVYSFVVALAAVPIALYLVMPDLMSAENIVVPVGALGLNPAAIHVTLCQGVDAFKFVHAIDDKGYAVYWASYSWFAFGRERNNTRDRSPR